jgi:endonuclease YncB( thermonuclease family)
MRTIILLLVSALLLASCVAGPTPATVQRVIDGDTFVTSAGDVVRLAYVDAPEITQAYGQESKRFVEKLILHKEVRLQYITADIYNRNVCNVFLNKKVTLNKLLIDSGYAWCYDTDIEYQKYEDRARSRCVGLWNIDSAPPIRPSLYRRFHRTTVLE